MNFLASLIYLWIAGMFLCLLIVKWAKHPCPLRELLPLSFLTGTGAGVYLLFIFYVSGIRFSLSAILVLLSFFYAGSAYLLVFAGKKSVLICPDSAAREKFHTAEKFLLSGILLQTLWVLLVTFPIPVSSHDAVANYALKAKMFFTNSGIPAGFFAFQEYQVAHPDYPLFLPLVMTWIYEFTGFNDLTVKMLMPVIYMAFLCLFYALSRKFFSRMYALLAVFMLSTIPQFADYAAIIHADFILTVFTASAVIYMALYIRDTQKIHLIFSSLLFGFSLLVKNEAIVFSGAFIMVMIALMLKKKEKRIKDGLGDLFIALSVMAIASAPWFIVKFFESKTNSDINLAIITPAAIWGNIKDIPLLLDLFQQEVFGPKKWIYSG